MEQVIANFGINAVEISPEGETVNIHSYMAGENIVIDVTDNGGGIIHEHKEKIFDLFFTTKKEGTGLGVAIVKKLLRPIKDH